MASQSQALELLLKARDASRAATEAFRKNLESVRQTVDKTRASMNQWATKDSTSMKNMFGSLSKTMETTAKGMAALGAAVGGTAAAIAVLAERGSEVAAVERAFNALAGGVGQSGEEIVRTTRAMSQGLISDFDIMANANKGILMGLPITSQAMGTLAQTAITLGQAMRQSASKSLEDLITGLGRGSPLILDNLGIMLKEEEAQKKYAESIGKTSAQLTSQEKTIAIYNAALTAAQARVLEIGGIHISFAERVQQAKVGVQNMIDTLGKAIAQSPVLNRAMEIVAGALQTAFGVNQAQTIASTVGFVNAFAITLVKAGQIGVEVAKFISNAWSGLNVMFFAALQVMTATLGAAAEGFAQVAAMATKIPKVGDSMKPIADGARAVADSIKGMAQGASIEMGKTLDNAGTARLDAAGAFLGKLLDEMVKVKDAGVAFAEGQKGVVAAVKSTGEAAGKAAFDLNKLAQFTGAAAQKEMDELGAMFGARGAEIMANPAGLRAFVDLIVKLREEGARVPAALQPIVARVQELTALEKAREILAERERDRGGRGEPLMGGAPIKELEVERVIRPTVNLRQALEDAAHAAQLLGLNMESTFGRIFGGITAGGAAVQQFTNLLSTTTKVGDKVVRQGFSLSNLGKGENGKFNVGALVGQVSAGMQVAGAAISIGKAIGGLFSDSPAEKAAKAAAKTLGEKISKELAEQIAATGKALGVSSSVASLLNLSDVMGASKKDPRTFAKPVLDLMAGIKAGTVPAREGLSEVGEAFGLMRDRAMEAGAVGDRALRDVIRRSRDLGQEIPAIQEFVSQQLKGAAGGMQGFLGLGVTGAETGGAQATIFKTLFESLRGSEGLRGAAEAMKAPFETLVKNLQEAGLDASALLGSVMGDMALAANEGFVRASDGARGLAEIVKGLANADAPLLTTQFQAFGVGAQQSLQQALAAGASMPQALQEIAPLLQNIMKASGSYGITLDANTQALIEQAKQAGIAFPTEPIDRAAAAMERLVSGLERVFGLSSGLPGNFQAAASAAASIRMPGGMQGGGFTGGGAPIEVPEFADGGVVRARPGGRLIRAGEGGEDEAIIPLSRMGGHRIGSLSINVEGTTNMDERALARSVQRGVKRGLRDRTLVDPMSRALRGRR